MSSVFLVLPPPPLKNRATSRITRYTTGKKMPARASAGAWTDSERWVHRCSGVRMQAGMWGARASGGRLVLCATCGLSGGQHYRFERVIIWVRRRAAVCNDHGCVRRALTVDDADEAALQRARQPTHRLHRQRHGALLLQEGRHGRSHLVKRQQACARVCRGAVACDVGAGAKSSTTGVGRRSTRAMRFASVEEPRRRCGYTCEGSF
mgnify:CR=1 FL=1